MERDYLRLLHDVLHNGQQKDTRNGKTRSVFGRQIRHKMSEGFPLLTTKKMPFRVIATELMWFLRGDTNIKFLVDNDCNIWTGDAYKNYSNKVQLWVPHLDEKMFVDKIKTDDEFAKQWGELGPIYGKQWRSWGSNVIDELGDVYTNEVDYDIQNKKLPYGSSNRKYVIDEIKKLNPRIDQITNLINNLKTNPDSRRLIINAWNVGELDQMVLPPCHYGFQVYTRELSFAERVVWMKNNTSTQQVTLPQYIDDKFSLDEYFKPYGAPTRAISLMWNQRSVDTFLGLPFNIASYGLLLEILAKAVNMVPDELIGNLGDVHLYENHTEQAREQLRRELMPLPKLNINTEFWPYEGGSCGEGPLDAVAVFNGFTNDNFCRCLLEEDLQLYNYNPHPTIKAPLLN